MTPWARPQGVGTQGRDVIRPSTSGREGWQNSHDMVTEPATEISPTSRTDAGSRRDIRLSYDRLVGVGAFSDESNVWHVEIASQGD